MKTIATRWMLVLGFGAYLASAAGAQQSPPLVTLRTAYDGYSMTSAPLNYAVQQGIFKRFGLDITPTFIEGGSMLTQAVVGGSLDMAQNGYTPAIAAAVQGADVVIIGGIANTLPYQLVVKAGITSAEQLKGKNVAISRYGSSTDAAADFALKHLGLTRKDVNVLQLGGASTRMAVGDQRTGRGHVRAISRHRRDDAAGLSRAGRSQRRGARLSEHVVRDVARASSSRTARRSRNS